MLLVLGNIEPLNTLVERQPQLGFEIVLGGLRPGGGDPWDEQMKDVIKHHWHEVNKRSGQPFGYSLFEREVFNYDTEPSCRAVVAARKWMGGRELAFFEAVSRRFYVENEDPTQAVFYRPICESFGIPFQEFVVVFESEETKYTTHQDFMLNRQWGVKGYPTVLLRTPKDLYLVSHGYAEYDQMNDTINRILGEVGVGMTNLV